MFLYYFFKRKSKPRNADTRRTPLIFDNQMQTSNKLLVHETLGEVLSLLKKQR